MEALLDGTPQFIVMAFGALMTSGQSTNVARIYDLFRRQGVRPTVRARVGFNLLLTGLWFTAISALAAVIRIITSIMVTHPLFIIFDIVIISLMGLGLLFMFISAILAWRVPWLSGPWQRQQR